MSAREAYREEFERYQKLDSELNLRLHKVWEAAAADDAIVHVGRTLEAILHEYWIRCPDIPREPSHKATLELLIEKTLPVDRFRMIRVHAEILQKMRNLAAHIESVHVDEGDAADAARRLLIILRWFDHERRALNRPATGGSNVTARTATVRSATRGDDSLGAVPGPEANTRAGYWDDSNPPLWTFETRGPWACSAVRGLPVLIHSDGPSILVRGAHADMRSLAGPGPYGVTQLILTADGAALAAITGESLAWADFDPISREPLRWVSARLSVGGHTLLAGIRRAAGVDLILAGAGQTLRLRVDSRGEVGSTDLSPWEARSAAVLGSAQVLIGKGGELEYMNGGSALLSSLPTGGWLALDAGQSGEEIRAVGVRDEDDGWCLYTMRPGQLRQARLSARPVAAQVSRSVATSGSGAVIVAKPDGVLHGWSFDDLGRAHDQASGAASTGGEG